MKIDETPRQVRHYPMPMREHPHPPQLCIYHGGCTDGIAAAWCAYLYDPTATFFPGVYQQEPPWDLIDDASVLLVDFTYKRPVLERIASRAQHVVILDHHKTAQDDLANIDQLPNVECIFDMHKCGAMLAWEHFRGDQPQPRLLAAIDAQDRWTPDRDAALIMALRSYPHGTSNEFDWFDWRNLMHKWSWLMSDEGYDHLQREAPGIFRYYRARVEDAKRNAYEATIADRTMPVVNATYGIASDVAGELAAEHSSGTAAVYFITDTGEMVFSLRARKGHDVSELAKQFGGGGHPGAAGFKISGSAIATFITQRKLA